ncbi:hypothetical protein DE146DRAFT_755231 [Phaeosphaeria sp. MPI-PUGE-AT-0046c]|nr:hypothetical protein DE146DRAFT_755231 [Phaeosphaeria sp. MPI-PUGE-AT-0046c]
MNPPTRRKEPGFRDTVSRGSISRRPDARGASSGFHLSPNTSTPWATRSGPSLTARTLVQAPALPFFDFGASITQGLRLARDSSQPADEAIKQIESQNSLFVRDNSPLVVNLPVDASIKTPVADLVHDQPAPSQGQDEHEEISINGNSRLQLLNGAGVEIVAAALVSHYSILLRNAYKRDRHSPETVVRIVLPEDDPSIFVLFVEWLYYGSYTPAVHRAKTDNPGIKNYAMKRLHAQHSQEPAASFTTSDVHYAMTQSPHGSKLRLFYEHLLPAWIVQPERTQGTTTDWDTFFQKNPDLRLFAVEAAREAVKDGGQAKDLLEELEVYLDEKKVEPQRSAKTKVPSTVAGVKRKADDVGVKDEPEL